MDPIAERRLKDAIRCFAERKVLVIGDIMLDRYVSGRVDRINPEAPVPILLAQSEYSATGGAGNTAKNAAALGADTTLIGISGTGPVAADLIEATEREGYRAVLIKDPFRRTIEKRRYIIRNQQMLRVDTEETGTISEELEQQVIAAIEREAGQVEAILVSDYAKGILTEGVAGAIMQAQKELGIVVMADIKAPSIQFFRGATAIAPNLKEAHEYLGLNRHQVRFSWHELALRLHEQFEVEVYLTLSEDGIYVQTRDTPGLHVPQVHRVEVADTSGCGDTTAVVLLLARLCGLTDPDAARLANAAGAVIASKIGATALSPDELIEALNQAEH
jgi:D-beta-D-heptose 7-phosphate kinase/D-beta-D-heptose 1-phosphate adenosyltransferase